jgi:glycosyltransferase involved in cell wall biosynthesis
LVISYEYPPVGGGGSDVCHHVARELAKKGHRIRVLTAHCAGLPFFERIDGYDVRRIRCFRRRPGGCSVPEMFAFVALASVHGLGECRRFRPDLVHIHHTVPDGPAGFWLNLLFRVPYVMTAHGGDVPGAIPALDAMFRRLQHANRRIWRRAAAVVMVAQHLVPLARRAFPEANVCWIPNGVDVETFHPPAEPRRNSETQILYAGRFNPEKGVETLVRAAGELRKIAHGPFRVILYGSGAEEQKLRRLARELGVADRVEFRGWVGRAEIAEAFRQGDVFCLPSLSEGMPVALLQAMASAMAVVATDTDGAREEAIDGESGRIVPRGDAQAMARALAALVESPEQREAFGRAGRRRCEEVFSWRIVGDQYETLFREILARAARPRP